MTETVGREDVQAYYGRVLKTKEDLKTSACCSSESMPDHVKPIMALLDTEILEKFYGCGSPIPPAISGCRILDLGCGTGRDVYILSKLVGTDGHVIGVDMTDEQLDVARRHRESMAEKFGYTESNVTFRKGYIEELDTLGIEDASIDVVISNCVMNLSFDKRRLLAEIFRVLKPGGELFFSDVFTSRRIPDMLKDDAVLIGECIAGAFYTEDFRRTMAAAGFPDVRILSSRPIGVHDADIAGKLGCTTLWSQTVRAFKLDRLEDGEEDYGQLATYLGSIPEAPTTLNLDSELQFERHRVLPVSGNVAAILSETRLAPHFAVQGNRHCHYGRYIRTLASQPQDGCGPSSCC